MFTEISTLLNDRGTLCINIIKTGETLAVTVFPQSKEVKDPAAKQLIPLVLKGTPEELDTGFIEAIKEPVQKSVGLLTNMAAYEKSVEKTNRESKEKKDKKDKIAKHIRDAEAAEKAGKAKEALAFYTQALELDNTDAKIRAKVSTLKAKVNGGSFDIFGSQEVSTEEDSTENEAEGLNDDDDDNE